MALVLIVHKILRNKLTENEELMEKIIKNDIFASYLKCIFSHIIFPD